MASDLNRVTLVGRLTRDPELRNLPSGDGVCSIRLAVSSRARAEDGGWTDKPNYFDVTAFGRQAETAAQYLAKGRRIGVDGRLAWREWEAKDGGRRQSVEVVAGDLFFLDSRRDGAEGAEAEAAVPVGATAGTGDEEDVPF